MQRNCCDFYDFQSQKIKEVKEGLSGRKKGFGIIDRENRVSKKVGYKRIGLWIVIGLEGLYLNFYENNT